MTPSRQKPDGNSALQRAPNLILTNSLFGQKPLPSVVPDAIRPIETTRVLVANRRDDSGVAARGARAAAGEDAADRCADDVFRERPRRTGRCCGVPAGTPEARVDRGPQPSDRLSLGGT